MAGKIRTREKCPQCDNPFKITEEVDIFCPTCNTRPKTFYIFLYHDKKKHRISRDTVILKDKLPEAFIFTNSKGKSYQGNVLRKMWNRAREKAGIKVALKNATRHSIASQAINEGVPLEVISKALGHSSLEITKQKYARMEIESLRVMVEDRKIIEIGAQMVQK